MLAGLLLLLAALNPALRNPGHEFWKRSAPRVFRVRLETTQGAFIIEAHRNWAQRGVDRFHNLVRAGFFDNLIGGLTMHSTRHCPITGGQSIILTNL